VRRPLTLSLLFASLAACGSPIETGPGFDASTPPTPYTGTPGRPIAADNVLDILIVPVTVNGITGTAIVDTGSPIVALDPPSFADAGLPNGAGPVAALDVGALDFPGATVVGANLIGSPDPTVALGGSLGCVVLCDFAVSLNYRDSELTLGPAATPPNIEAPGVTVPFTLGGGELVTLTDVPGDVTFPASRVMLTVTIEGTEHPFVVDTGSSFVTLRESVFEGLVADGRTVISGIGTATVGMESSSSVARLRSIVVGGAEVTGAVGADDPNIEQTLDDIATETGSAVDGLVGGSFLRQFFVTVDYPSSALQLRRYTRGGPTFDLFDRVGIAISPTDGSTRPTVAGVFEGTSASKLGVATGDVVVAIDGHALATLGSTAINTLLSGAVGSTKMVEFGAAAAASLSMKTVSVDVDDVLAL
jgi:hypothetical protein